MQPLSDPMLALDPAMLTDAASLDDDSDYEYEYHDQETETFYLNLDLTSYHGSIRPPRRRQGSQTATSSAGATPRQSSVLPDRGDENESTLASTEIDGGGSAEGVQILGLHTPNPIVSYQNQIFSCSWAEQIGTELLFSRPERDADADADAESESAPQVTPLKRGKDYDLVAANSVKILGRKANLISSSGVGPAQESATAGTPRKKAPLSNQALFVQRLKNIKQVKGETDSVRTAFSFKRSQNLEERLRGWARTDEQLAEIQRLSDAAVQGDANALAELEYLYTQIGSQQAAGSSEDLSQQR